MGSSLDKIGDISSVDDIKNPMWSNDLMSGKYADYRYNTEDALLMILEKLTSGTQLEDIGKEIPEKARAVFDYYSDKN